MIKIIPDTKKNSVVKLEDDEYEEFIDKPEGYAITQCEKQLPKEYVKTPIGGYFIRKDLVARVVEE